MIEFQALGSLTITEGGAAVAVGGPRQRRLVAMLLIHRNNVVSVDRLADAVFAGEPTPAAGTTLRSYVARIRRVVDGNGARSMVVTQAPGYMLRLGGESFDVASFERLLAEARACSDRDDPTSASSLLRQALALWRGDAYAEFADEDWAQPEAQRLGELRLVAHERLIEAELACGRAAEMTPEIEALVADHPLRESFRSQLMVALYRSGRQADALQVYRDYREVLVEELGLDPSPMLAELERRVLTHDPVLLLAEPAGLPLRGYRLSERLGTGRDGTVFAAHLAGVERDLAVRVIREEIADHPEFVRTFEADAQRVAALRHPAIVALYDYWRQPGAAYLVMQRMHGGTLADRLRRGPLTTTAVGSLVGRVGGALVAAAAQGVVHGRVAAESVLFDDAGEACLGDFALGRAGRTEQEDVHDLAVMIGACLAHPADAVADVLARATATVTRPSMVEFVEQLGAALTGADDLADLTVPNPYKGLRAFDEADAADFFGRAELVDEILGRLACDGLRGRLVLVVGGSGTGKSSVVRAGLLPRVRRGDVPGSRQWFITTMLPGSSPFKELAESIRRVAVDETTGLAQELAGDMGGIDRVLHRLVPDGGELLLVVDQFEELFTLATEEEQRALLAGLMHAVSVPDSRLRVVATLRADFYDRPLAFQRFGGAVNDATVTIPAMSPAELEAAVVEPAARVGGQVERALVAELVSAVADQPAALPSLQFALYELAERTPERHLTMSDYRALGGIDGAIASRAELLYTSLDGGERAVVQRMFERLVVIGAEGEPTRRRAARAELASLATEGSVDTVVDRWANARLLTLDRHPQTRVPTVELAHEALLREWPRLREWIEDDRAAIATLGHLREAAANWIELDRDRGALYRGARLELALDAAAARSTELPAEEREFLHASREARDTEQREAAERIDRQARANRRLRIQLAAIGVALVVALVGGFVALDQRRDAQRQQGVATARELAAASAANLDVDPERSMLLALAAVDQTRSSDGIVLPEAEEALHRAVSASRIVASFPGVGGSIDWSPDGTVFVHEGEENSGLIDIRDAETGESVRSFQGHDVDVNMVAFGGDGSLLATTGDDGALRVWDPSTGEQLLEFVDHLRADVLTPSFSADGSRVVATWLDDRVRVIDVATGGLITELKGSGAVSAGLSPDGSRVAVGHGFLVEPAVTVFDATTGTKLFTLRGDHLDIGAVAWSPDGRWIATSSFWAPEVGIWNAETGEQRFTLTGHTGGVTFIDWSPDSSRLATNSDDGRSLVTEITDAGAREVFSFSAQNTSGGLAGVAFSPDGQRLMTGNYGITAVTVWDVSPTGGGELATVEGVEPFGIFDPVDFMPNDREVAVAQADGSVSIANVVTGAQRASIPGDGAVASLDVSDDGQLLATASLSTVEVRDASTGELRFEIPARDGARGLEWSPNSDVLAAIDNRGQGHVVIVDRSGVEVTRLPEAPGHLVESIGFSPDGRLLATVRIGLERVDPETMDVTIWDWQRGAAVRTIEASADRFAFDPTGATIATSRLVESVIDIWDASTGGRLQSLAAPSDVVDLTYSPDGSVLATGHADGTVRLWDPETGITKLVLGGGIGVSVVAVSPDGSTLASQTDDGVVHVWALDLDDLIAIANDRLTRQLSDDECRQYLHLERCPSV